MRDSNSMANISDAGPLHKQPRANYRLGIMERLVRAKATTGLRSAHFWIIFCVFAAFGYIYYGLLTTLHDIYVIIFFYPLIYAAIVYRLRGVVISGLIVLGILLPYALLFPLALYSLVISLLLFIFGLLVSGLGATLLNYLEQQLESYKEIVSLNEELNSYIDRLESTQKQLIQAEKLSSLGQMAASIAHEVNNPLAGVLVYTKLLSKKIANGTISKDNALGYLSKMDSELTRSSRLIRNLLDFARQSPPTLREVNPNDVIDRALDLAEHSAVSQNIQVIKELSVSLPRIMADFDQLIQVCTNLILNAIQAMPQGGNLTLRTSSDGSQVKIECQDTGHGISSENMGRLFTPFFTTKHMVKGVGLGLAVSYGIIQRHKGRIEVQSREGEGTTFSIYLPLPIEH